MIIIGSIKLNGVSYTPLTIKNETSNIEGFQPIESEKLTTSILEKALILTQGTYEYSLGGSTYTGDDLPNSNYKYSQATVRTNGVGGTKIVILWGVLAGDTIIQPMFNQWNQGSWSGWQTISITKDLEKYLPLTGGKISKASYEPLLVENTQADASGVYVRFLIDGVSKGQLGVSSDGIPIFYSNADSKGYHIIHKGNIESYTGSNIPKTIFDFTNTINWSIPDTNLETFYLVKNGWCFLHVVARCNVVTSDDNSTVFTGLPLPPFQVYNTFSGNDNTYEPCQLTIGTGGQMILRGGTVGKDYSFTYTYPVA